MIVWSHLMCVFSDAGRIGPNRRQRINQSEWRVQNHPNRCNYIQQEQCDIFNKESESEFNFFIYNGPSIFQSNSRLLNNGPSYQQNHTPFYESDWSFCKLCRIYRPPGAHHCDICRHCILQMDHHCPCVHTGLFLLASFIFGIFTMAIFFDQLQTIFRETKSINTDLNNIHRRASSRIEDTVFGGPRIIDGHPKQTRTKLLRQMFGNIPIILWAIPYPFKSASKMIEQKKPNPTFTL
ncbi:hypothetical protein NH340_JMT06758 [Sarcoptes scabiei]|nr:hypothetical protein NH340_JMT06758 [Sarcoptes scabiei]